MVPCYVSVIHINYTQLHHYSSYSKLDNHNSVLNHYDLQTNTTRKYMCNINNRIMPDICIQDYIGRINGCW